MRPVHFFVLIRGINLGGTQAGPNLASDVHHDLHDGIAVVTLDRPVANALAPSVRRALLDILKQTSADPAVCAIVLQGAGTGFSSGVDITEYDGPLSDPWVSDLCTLIETTDKPVVACLHGPVLGAGFELALAAHARVACQSARLALPEVTLGLIPSAGATQRLPRIIGAQAALEFMLSGQSISVTDPRMARVCDRLVDHDPLPAAIDLARDLATRGTWRRTCDHDRGFSDPDAYQKAVRTLQSELPKDDSPEMDLVRCVEAAPLLPFERGLEFEQALFQDRLAAPSARARRHIYTAEKRAGIWPELTQSPTPRPVAKVAILGAGPLVSEVIVALLDGGKEVLLAAPTGDATDKVLKQVVSVYSGAVARKRLQVAQRDDRLIRLRRSEPGAAIAEADLVLDAGAEITPEDVAQRGVGTIWAVMGEGPGVSVAMVEKTPALGGLGVRFNRPAYSMRAVELIVPTGSDPAAVAGFVKMLQGLGRIVIRTSDAPAGVGDRLKATLYHAALALAGSGVSPYHIDEAARALGFAHGPFEMMDIDGLGRVSARLAGMGKVDGLPRLSKDNLLQACIAGGALGKRAGKGFYLYTEDAPPALDPAVSSWCDDHKEASRSPASPVAPGTALLSALANAAARLIEANDVQRASDIDVAAVHGLGFDRRKGGPLLQADLLGILRVLKALRSLAPVRPELWHAHPRIEDMVKTGHGFFGRAV